MNKYYKSIEKDQPSGLIQWVWDLLCFEDLEEKDHWLNQGISDKVVCRTALATPGLLITHTKVYSEQGNL